MKVADNDVMVSDVEFVSNVAWERAAKERCLDGELEVHFTPFIQ